MGYCYASTNDASLCFDLEVLYRHNPIKDGRHLRAGLSVKIPTREAHIPPIFCHTRVSGFSIGAIRWALVNPNRESTNRSIKEGINPRK